MAKFKLAFGIHNHQPVGNFDHVFEYAHRQAYEPFLQLLEEYGLSISLHQSGILWDWQEKHFPEYLDTVKRMVKAGQLELMTGGFYEPILTSIPERDSEGQIAAMSGYLTKHFGVEPNGLWLTERIWEPHLPRQLALSGVKYLPVDDTHFIYAGFEHSQLTGPFVTEHENFKVKLLPISKRLRYLIPFGTIEEVIAELKGLAENNPSGMVIYADDGEKFGSWPKTHEHCYQDKWLKRLFEALQQNSDWLEVVPLGQAAKAKPVGRAYLPTASYAEMLHWSLPPKAFVEYEKFEDYLKTHGQTERYGRFVRGGHWRGFLAKYDEANLMHKKMLSVSEKLASAGQHKVNEKQLSVARERLYAGQCNCPYWHGVFGGLYLPHIRQAIFASLVEADTILNRISANSIPNVGTLDYDADGADEIVVDTDKLSAVFRPDKGGTLLELSLNDFNFSLTDTLTRRREGYHLKLDDAVTSETADKTASIHDLVLAKEEGLKDVLIEDWYLKRCFIDHFFNGDIDFESFRAGTFREDGDFVLEPYEFELLNNPLRIKLARNGHLWRPSGVMDVRLVKTFTFDNDSGQLNIDYEISSGGGDSVEVNFAVENNFNMQAGHHESRYVLIDGNRPDDAFLDANAAHHPANSFGMFDQSRDLGVAVICDTPGRIWQTPILTVSLSESGFEKVYQGTTFVHVFSLRLSEKPIRLRLTLLTGHRDEVSRKVKESVAETR